MMQLIKKNVIFLLLISSKGCKMLNCAELTENNNNNGVD
ncbi:hypothetical protein JOC78_000889 [Bacillus ectoiniformans]|nr:hypothetical protein [Bacillus ectoiniformans]